MISSRVSRWIVPAAFFLAYLPGHALAQTPGIGPPVDLSAPEQQPAPADKFPLIETPVPQATPQPGTTSSGPRRLVPGQRAAPALPDTPKTGVLNAPRKAGIEVDGLNKIDSESVGVLNRRDGGFGIDMWRGVTRTDAVALIDKLPPRSGSAALREVASLLLLSRAKAPVAADENAPSLLVARVRALLAMGDVDATERLLAAGPRQGRPAGLDAVDAQVQILRYNNARACGLARNSSYSASDDFWQRLLVYCDALDGKADSVNFGVSLLREAAGDDPALVLLADAVLSQQPVLLEKIDRPTPVHIALSRAAKVELPPTISESDNPLVLHGAAMTPNLTVGARIESAERAVPMGALAAADLRRLYQQVTFEGPDLANALTRAQEIGGAAARALLYQAAAKQNIPAARAEIISNALAVAREDGRYQAAVEAFRPLIDRLPPSPEMVWFALTGVRAYLALGDPVGTDRWLALLRASATIRDESKVALARVRPLARMLGAGDKSVTLQTAIAEWHSSLGDRPEIPALRALLNGMFVAVGEPVPNQVWQGIVAGPPKNQIMPSPVTWFLFRDSLRKLSGVEGGVQGTGALSDVPPGAAKPAIYALQAMGDGQPGAQGVAVVYEVVAAFRTLGFERTARKLAVETLLAAGL